MALDQEDLAGIARDGTRHRVRDDGQTIDLIGRDLPRAEVEIDRIDVDARHAPAQWLAEADLLERIALVDGFDRRRHQRLVDDLRRGARGFDDVALARDAHDRRRQVDEVGRLAGDAVIVGDDDLTAFRRAADAPDQAALLVGHGDDARTVRPLDDRRHLAAATVYADLASDHEEAAGLVVPDDRLSAVLDDDAVRLANDEAVAFTHFAAFVAQGIDTVDRLSLRTGRLRHDRAARLDGGLRRRLRDGRRGRGRRCRR